ncbi:MAG: NAD(P)H-dependent oxidoreductase [Verrucomicrobia bacterium]|nr:NAD(P)H-dependent oxidoreductase [Verrucomicrobiota bacterium]
MEKTLILFTHPALEKSKVHRALKEGVENLEGVTFHDLYEEYPDFYIDVQREQALLLEHSKIIWQHPLYWYSVPALMKEWIDVVLQHGWAYGSDGTVLEGKTVKSVISTGGSEKAYCPQGHNYYPVEEFLRPLERTAVLCRMEYLEPMIFYGAFQLDGDALSSAVDRYRKYLQTS